MDDPEEGWAYMDTQDLIGFTLEILSFRKFQQSESRRRVALWACSFPSGASLLAAIIALSGPDHYLKDRNFKLGN